MNNAVSPKSQSTGLASGAHSLRGPHFDVPVSNATDGSQTTSASTSVAIRATGLKKAYRKGNVVVPVLKGVDFSCQEGEFTAIVGQSGSGKSTLLHLLGTLDVPDAGEIYFRDCRIDNIHPAKRDALRNQQFGMIFQFYHLLPELSTLENVVLPQMIRNGVWGYWKHRRALRARAMQLLETVGLSHRLRHRPKELSGGEMQRVAIARALMTNPRLLLADEPTGNLDHETGEQIMHLLTSLNKDHQLTIIMVTHDQLIAKRAHRTVQLVEGCVKTI
ncbi:MAG: ABC transporter ATP-binding protein [Planctomycetales bacterium]|nr:ABC transporter ATP-binding protein [Planctomycetales bacterium]